jgi:hypothetical protein
LASILSTLPRGNSYSIESDGFVPLFSRNNTLEINSGVQSKREKEREKNPVLLGEDGIQFIFM